MFDNPTPKETGPAPRPCRASRDWLLLCGLTLSGAGAIGFELIWLQLLGLALGAERFGLLAVLAGFFVGLALGAALLHSTIRNSKNPARIYIACEAGIAIYGLASPWLLKTLLEFLPRFLGPMVADNRSLFSLGLNLLVATIAMLPATVCMGATTVALVEAWRRCPGEVRNAQKVGRLYAANTFGAVLGVVGSRYLLLPNLGLLWGAAILSGLCSAAALTVWFWRRRNGSADESAPLLGAASARAVEADVPVPGEGWANPKRLYGLLFFTGFVGIGFEYLATYILAQMLHDTVHTFANILAVYLIGTAAGAWLYTQRRFQRIFNPWGRGTAVLLLGLCWSIIGTGYVLAQAPGLLSHLAPEGATYGRYLAAEAIISFLVFFPPTIFMGALFSHLVGPLAESGVGFAYAANTLGASLGPAVFGLVLIGTIGVTAAFYVTACTYLALYLGHELLVERRPGRAAIGGMATVAAILMFHHRLVLVRVPDGFHLVAQKQGLHGIVSISERSYQVGHESGKLRLLQVSQHFLMGGALGFTERRMGHLPVLCAKDPADVLFLGIGTGITAGASIHYPAVRRVVAVELVPEAVELLPWFVDQNNDLLHQAKVEIHASDARRFLRASRDRHNLIVADLFHPSGDGMGFLYTQEHFKAVRQHLHEGGLFVQWLPLYQLKVRDLQTIIRTFLDVFPDAHSLFGNLGSQATLGLFGWVPGSARNSGAVQVQTMHARLTADPAVKRVIHSLEEVLASYVLDAKGLREFAGPGPINTDLNQRILFDAAQSVGTDDPLAPVRCMMALLPRQQSFPDGFVSIDPAHLPEVRRSVERYRTAASHYIQGELLQAQAGQASPSAASVVEFLAAFQSDPRFVDAPRMLLEIAGRDPSRAADIVQRMSEARPHDGVLPVLLRELRVLTDPDAIRQRLLRYLQFGT